MKNPTIFFKSVLAIIYVIIIALVLSGLVMTIQLVLAVQPLKSMLPSSEGVAQWRHHIGMNILGYSLDVDHVLAKKGDPSVLEYYKMISIPLPGVRFRVPSNTDSIKTILINPHDPSSIFASVDLQGSAVTMRVKDTTVHNYILIAFLIFISGAIAIAIIWLLMFKNLLRDISTEDTQFTSRNVRRLKMLGLILVGVPLLKYIIEWSVNMMVVRNFNVIESGTIETEFRLQILIILFGFTLITVSKVISNGIRMKEEQELIV